LKKLFAMFGLLFIGAVVMFIGTAVKRETGRSSRNNHCYGDYDS
jgi:hypothetical protein